MKLTPKSTIVVLTLLSFLAIALFGFSLMMSDQDGRMTDDCPLSTLSQSACPQDIVAVVSHHLSAYYTFLNILVGTGLMNLIAILLFVVCVMLVIRTRPPSLKLPVYSRLRPRSLFTSPLERKIIHWLSLFENSPSYI